MKVCVTGATGFLGGHVARLLAERGDEVAVTYRDPERLERLEELDLRPIKADILDRRGMRRALKGAEVAFHTAGFVGSRPADKVWEINALSPRVVVEAAAAEGVRRVVMTSSVAALGPAPKGEVGDESQLYRGGGLGLTYANSKHEGEREAFLAGARLGVDVVVANPSYVFGVPVDRSQPGETSTRIVANYLRGRMPAVIDGSINAVDVEDVAVGHLLAAEKGKPSERYMLGGENVSWVDLIDRLARLSGVNHPALVIPPELGVVAQARERLGLPGPIAAEGYVLMGQNWQYSSRKAERELGFSARPLDETLRATIEWYREIIADGIFEEDGRSPLSVAAHGVRLWSRLGATAALRAAEKPAGRRLVAGVGG